MAEGWLVEFCQKFRRVALEFFDTGSAAEFHLLALVDDALFVTHGAEFVVRDDAELERVGFNCAG